MLQSRREFRFTWNVNLVLAKKRVKISSKYQFSEKILIANLLINLQKNAILSDKMDMNLG